MFVQGSEQRGGERERASAALGLGVGEDQAAAALALQGPPYPEQPNLQVDVLPREVIHAHHLTSRQLSSAPRANAHRLGISRIEARLRPKRTIFPPRLPTVISTTRLSSSSRVMRVE